MVPCDYKIPQDSKTLKLLASAVLSSMIFAQSSPGTLMKDACDGYRNAVVIASDNFADDSKYALGSGPHPAIKYQKASWRRMLPSQPPVRKCRWDSDAWCPSDFFEEDEKREVFRGELSCDHDMTCQDFLKATTKYFARAEQLNMGGNGMIYPDEYEEAEMLAEQGVKADQSYLWENS